MYLGLAGIWGGDVFGIGRYLGGGGRQYRLNWLTVS